MVRAVGRALRCLRQGRNNVRLRALLSLAAIIAVGATGVGVAGASTTPTEYFTATQTTFDGPTTVVAAGPISATGTDNALGRHRDDFGFPDRALHIRHQAISQHQKFDADTCVGRFWEKGTYAVTGGTGAYENVSGSGRYNVTGVIQGC